MALVASLLIILLLLDKKLSRTIPGRFVAVYTFIAVALLGLIGIGSYAAGSCRETDNTVKIISLTAAVPGCVGLRLALNYVFDWKPIKDMRGRAAETMARRGAEEGLRLPPGPVGVPVLGNLHQFGWVPHRSLRDMARRHGPVMLLRLGTVRAVVVSSAAAARDVMRTHDAHCCSRPASLGSARLSYGRNSIAFSPYTAYWRDMRGHFAAQLLGARSVGAAWAARREQVNRLMAVLGDAATAAEPVAMDLHVFRVVDGINSAVVYGGAEAELVLVLEHLQQTM